MVAERMRAAIPLALLFILLTSGVAPVGAAASSTATPFQHVIVIVQENHSFDNYFGTYPTANGTLVTPITSQLPSVNGIPESVCLPYGSGCVRLQRSNSTSPTNPIEGQLNYELDYSNNVTGFPRNSGTQSMVYFDYRSIPAYWDYAEEYGLADNYFAPFLTQSDPNRLAMISGDSPTPTDVGPPPYLPYNQTLMYQLDKAGVTWGSYDYFPTTAGQTNLHFLRFISGMTRAERSNIENLSRLYTALATGSGLPSVSFVDALGNKTYDEHPPSNPTTGEQWVVSLVNDVMSSSYWSSTAIFITWDEGGGFYDHVAPPVEFTVNHAFQSPLLAFGQRIPLIVISPYSREAYVSHTLMSHLSLTHFVDYNWNLTPLTPNIGSASLPLGFFNFTQQPRSPLILGSSGQYSMTTYPIPLQIALNQSSTGTSSTASGSGGFGGFSGSVVYVAVALVAVALVAVAAAASILLVRRSRRRVETEATVPAPPESS